MKKTPIPLASPDINDGDISEVVRVLKSGMLVQGVDVEKLENDVSKIIGVSHTVAVSNGTASLHLLLIANGIGKGDEVIIPAFSYVATANVVELVGATPIFVDIDINTFNIDVNKIEDVISKKTKAIIPVHEFGLICDIASILNIAQKHNLLVFEDAACALGASDNNKKGGAFGNAGSFSLHPRKAITCGEGGLITTNDDSLATKLRILRNHGIKYANEKMDFVEAGFNYRMTNFQGALAASQLKRLDDIISVRNSLSEVYFNEINNSEVKLPSIPANKVHSWQSFHVVLSDRINQKKAISFLKSKGIGSNYGAQCIPFQSYYMRKYGLNSSELFPHSLRAFNKGIAIPIYEKLSSDDIKYISKQVNKISSKTC